MSGWACLVGCIVNDRRASDADAGNRQRQNRSRRDRARAEKFVAFERTIGVLEHNLDEWRRFHDWIVLTKGKLDLIEEIISLGHKYSGLLSRYKVSKEPEQEPLLRDLRIVLQMMQTLYMQSRDRRGFDLNWKPL
jgi:hypothetical protein